MKRKLNILYNWLKKNSKILKNIALFISVIASLLAIISHFSDDKISQTNYIDSSTTTNNSDSSSTTIDLSTTNNNTDASTTNVFIEKVEDKNKIDNTLVYNILGVKNKKLEKLIKDSMKISFINNASNNIDISYTGQVQLLSNNSESYIYTGGFIILTINSNICYEFENYKIPAMRANPKSMIVNELKKVISLSVEQNVNEFSKKIIQCLKS